MKSSGSNNIFCASNPAKILDALWTLIVARDFSNDIIFLPSRRAVRAVEKMIAQKSGATILPRLVALGEEAEIDDNEAGSDVVSNTERTLVLARLLAADPNLRTMANALPLARDRVRMQDYLENERRETRDEKRDWMSLVDEKYAKHFQKKAEFLTLADSVMPDIFPNKITSAQKRNAGIREWTSNLDGYKRVIVCGSTASVPATSDLMARVADMDNGYIILPGKIVAGDQWPVTSPYYCEHKFLEKIKVLPSDVQIIDVGESAIDFFNSAFDNTGNRSPAVGNWSRIDCARESEEAEVVAEIAARALGDNKTVLVITPDAAGNQRIAAAFARRCLHADFSGGTPAAMSGFGRAILNAIDEMVETGDRKQEIGNLFGFIENLNIDATQDDAEIIEKLAEVSDILKYHKITPTLSDMRAIVADALRDVRIRAPMADDAKIAVLGTIESRMQTSDVVILTGLNDGMFPARGYENAWLPRNVAAKIGLPSADRKVSLMAMDFINLSCGREVYWTRSRIAGSAQTTESRFLSRVGDRRQEIGDRRQECGARILEAVRGRDNVATRPLDYAAPTPPADRTDVYVTDLELLIHNPYAYYAKHILRLRPKNDYWTQPDARDFGMIVHEVIEKNAGASESEIVACLDRRAMETLGADNVIFHFWHKRFIEIAPEIEKLLQIKNAQSEIELQTIIAGRRVRARADMVYGDAVLDIKTGGAPTAVQLEQGNMPQLPLEAHMRGAGIMQFLQLRNNDVQMIEYSGDQAKQMIDAAVQKTSELFGRYAKDFEPYEYLETSDRKYKAWDDLARVDD